MPRSASLTAASDGNTSAISGSSSARLLPLRSWAAYFPRTPPFIEAKSYSARISLSLASRTLLIESSLAAGCTPGTDDSNPVATLRVDHDQRSTTRRNANAHESLLRAGMFCIRKRGREHVAQHGCGFMKTDAMLSAIGHCLRRIPHELHG